MARFVKMPQLSQKLPSSPGAVVVAGVSTSHFVNECSRLGMSSSMKSLQVAQVSFFWPVLSHLG